MKCNRHWKVISQYLIGIDRLERKLRNDSYSRNVSLNRSAEECKNVSH